MKEWFSAKELADLGLPSLGKTKRAVSYRAKAENWPSRPREGQGGGREFHLDDLPTIIKSEVIQVLRMSDAILKRKFTEEAEESLAKLIRVNSTQLQKAEIRETIIKEFNKYLDAEGLPVSKAREEFCKKYNERQIFADNQTIRAIISGISPKTLFSWESSYKKEGLSGLVDSYGNRKGDTKIDRNQELKGCILGLIYEYPHIDSGKIMSGLRSKFREEDLPSYRTVQTWVKRWKKDNASTFTAIKNPDEWKNKFMAASGSFSENIVRLNQLWEFDSTPTDIILNDGERHNIVGVIDVYSRRVKFLVSKTSNSTAVSAITRACLLEWGVPESIKTDNGADYASKYMCRVFDSLEIERHFCKPFTPEQKPHIERVFRTFSHDVLEVLPGYIGHNVSERKNIEARKSFADHIMGKAKRNPKDYLSVEELQKFCDDWINNCYMVKPHGGLNGKTPLQMIADYKGTIQKIQNERALDILLSPTSGDGLRTVQPKKGIAIDNAFYDSQFLGGYENQQVKVLYDEANWGEVYVFTLEGHFICKAICPERKGISRAEVAAARKAQQKRLINESKQVLKKLSKIYKTKDIAGEIMQQKAKEQPNVVLFPKPEISYNSQFLAEAEKVLENKKMPVSRQLSSQEKRIIDKMETARNNNVVEMPREIMARQRFVHWQDLDNQLAKGERLNSEEMDFYRNYQFSSEFSAMRRLEASKAEVM